MSNYRGKTKDGKEVKGDLITEGNRAFIFSKDRKDGWLFDYDNFNTAKLHSHTLIEVIPETVGQSTGKKDIKKKEIYSGNKLLSHIEGDDRDGWRIWTVVWNNNIAAYQIVAECGFRRRLINTNGLKERYEIIHDKEQ